jgi:hypothetical protein
MALCKNEYHNVNKHQMKVILFLVSCDSVAI